MGFKKKISILRNIDINIYNFYLQKYCLSSLVPIITMRYLSYQRQCKFIIRAFCRGTASIRTCLTFPKKFGLYLLFYTYAIFKYAGTPNIINTGMSVQNQTVPLVEESEKFVYPVARKDITIVDDFHGVKVPDVYRWLEDPDSAETQKYVDAQNNISQPFLENCEQWIKINQKLTKLWNYPKYGCPMQYGNYYYFFKNTGLQNQR